MKRLLLTYLLALTVSLSVWADPIAPLNTADQGSTEKPLWERVMEEERRQKEQGITGPVDGDRLKLKNPPPLPNPPLAPAPVKPQVGNFTPLERGAQGARVKAVQQALLSLGFGLPAGADEDYGGQTEDAVKAFQSSVNLPLTGKLDNATYQKLCQMTPLQGRRIWEDPSAAQFLPAPADVSGKKVRVLIDLSEHRLSVYDSSGKLQRAFPVASGAKDTPTNAGIKEVCEKLDDPTALAEKLWPDSKGTAFGKRLIDLNWYDPKSGSRSVSDEELHGTYELDSIGSYASHGCVRLTNESIEWLYKNLQLGDLVLIRE